MLQLSGLDKDSSTGVGGVDALGARRLMDSQLRGLWAPQGWGWVAGDTNPGSRGKSAFLPRFSPRDVSRPREKDMLQGVLHR